MPTLLEAPSTAVPTQVNTPFVPTTSGSSRVHELFDEIVRAHPNRLVAESTSYTLTYAEAKLRSIAIAKRLLDVKEDLACIKSNDPSISFLVGLKVSRTSEHFLPAFLAVSRIGATMVFPMTDQQISKVNGERKKKYEERNKTVGRIVDYMLDANLIQSITDDWKRLRVDENDIAHIDFVARRSTSTVLALMFTGGTVKEKCACVTH